MNRTEKLQLLLKEQNLDGILISNHYNIRYFSGFSSDSGYLFFSEKRRAVLTDFRYIIQAKQETKGFEIIEIKKGYSYKDAVFDLIKEEKIEKLGFESKDISYQDYFELEQKITICQWVPIKEELSLLRAVKEEAELELIKKAASISDLAFSKILPILKPGITELEVAANLEYFMKTNGAEKCSFSTIAASGIHSSMPHAAPTDKKLEKGDFLTMDFGCVYQGYCSDMTRTVVIGKASKEQKKIYETVLRAQQIALDFIKAGYKGKEIDKAARDFIEKSGYLGCFGHGLGHGVGLYIHEEPRLSLSEERIIEENMVETIEPGIYIEGFGGVRIEDLVGVTKNGCINFTHSSKDFIEI